MNYGPSTSCLLLLLYDEQEAQNVPNIKTVYSCVFNPVFWIHGILVRIQIRGSVPLTYGSGSGSAPDPALFVRDL
jgi:hypothetical protein